VASSCEHGDEPSGSIKCGEFLDQLSLLSASKEELCSMELVRTGTKQVDIPHLLTYLIDKCDGSSRNWYGSRKSKDTTCNVEGRKLIDLCEEKTEPPYSLSSLE
jgi:hypothetical protein